MFLGLVETSCNRITCDFSGSGDRCYSLLPLETFTLVWSVVLLCLLFPYPACIRYKVRPAWLVGGDIGRKFALRGQNAPNWAILGEQGEFCPAHAVRRGVQGEFCSSAAQSVCPGAELPPPMGTAARQRRGLSLWPRRGCVKERSPLRSTGRSFGVPL